MTNGVAAKQSLKDYLDEQFEIFNEPGFIKNDPVSIPHRFSLLQDIEIAGLFAATLAWGNRVTIIKKSIELMELMDNSPYQFITQHEETDLKKLLHFKHRTFNTTDLLYFISFFKHHYSTYNSLEKAFSAWMSADDQTVENALIGFHKYFFSLEDHPSRTKKHIATPLKKSTCKRLNMYLRWMVRNDQSGVDFGLWKEIQPSQLVCPIDLHVARVAAKLGLLSGKQTNWATAVDLTEKLRKFDANDPVKYDFALFGLGISGFNAHNR